MPLGSLVLLAGREGLGKSTVALWVAAQITRGLLPGEHYDTPRDVLVIAAEDSWSRTLVPRLMAAGADLERIHRVDVMTELETLTSLVVPLDTLALRDAIMSTSAALVIVDPLVSVISGSIDTHRDADTRQALQPLATIADSTAATIVGLVHHSKAATDDALNLVLGSRAFVATARAVLSVVADPEADDGTRMLALSKSNLGRLDLPALSFRVESALVPTAEGAATTGRVVWTGEHDVDVADLLRAGRGDPDERADRDEAADWLRGYLTDMGGEASAADVRKACSAAELTWRTVQRARSRAGVGAVRSGFGQGSVWSFATHSRRSRQDTDPGTNGANGTDEAWSA